MSGVNAGPPPSSAAAAAAMRWVPGGTFLMGSADFYPEERPVHDVRVDGFWMDEHPVTVAEFRRFVKATGHVTLAEHAPEAVDYPDADPALLVPGSLVFVGADGPVPLDDYRRWWAYVPGACWQRPEGPNSDTYRRGRHPVTQVGFPDAVAYAEWAGKALPTEAEWERAARGGLEGATFAWGDDPLPGGRHVVNTWQGEFPWRNTAADGYAGTSPVNAFPPNLYGLRDMCGNVWEWTTDPFRFDHAAPAPCCAAGGRRGGTPDQRVIKGGSHLCAPSYCLRYRPAARQGEPVDSSTSHIGFRCVVRP